MTTKKVPLEIQTDLDEAFDVPLLSRQGTYRDPNVPLPLDREHLLQLTANHFVSERTIILGQTGMGKGNAGALITEFLLEAGLPLTFIDLEGEGYSFKEICSSLLVVGRSAHADREYTADQMGRLAELSVTQGFSVVLDFSGYADDEIFALVTPYLQSLWTTCERLRTPYHLILDEAHELVPEEGTTPVKALLRRIAKRGRKHGLGIVAMTQETASLDKKFLRQMAIRILLPVIYEADLKIYHSLIPGISLDTLKNTMPAFSPGTGYVVFNHRPYLVHLLRRHTYDPSETPKLGQRTSEPALRAIDTATLQLLDEALPVSPGEETPLERLDRASLISLLRNQHRQPDITSQLQLTSGDQRRLKELQEEVSQKQEHINQLEAQIRASQSNNNGIGSATLHIGELHHQIEAATLEVGTLQGARPLPQRKRRSSPVAKKKTVAGAGKVSATPVQTLPGSSILQTEKELLARQARRVENLSSLEKRLFRWLLEHQNVPFTLTQLSQKTGVPRGHLYTRNLVRLSALDFVVKARSPQSYCVALTIYWKTNLASYPNLKLIHEQLWQAAKDK